MNFNNFNKLISPEVTRIENRNQYPEIPKEAFDAVTSDLNNLKDSNEILNYKVGEVISIAINSGEKKRYQILDAKKGHYLLSKIDHDPIVLGQTECIVILSNELRNKPNPDLIVCSSQEIENWLK